MKLIATIKPYVTALILSGLCMSCAGYPSKRVRAATGAVELGNENASGNALNSKANCQEISDSACGPFSAEEIAACKKFSAKDLVAQEICNGNEWSKKFRSEITAYLESKKSNPAQNNLLANASSKNTEQPRP